MALLTILTVASEIASSDKAMKGLSDFAKKGSNAIKNLLKDVDDLPELTERDFQNMFEYTDMLSSLLGQGAKVDDEPNLDKMEVISEIVNELCFSEKGYMQEPLLIHIGSSIEEFEISIASTIKNPSTIKKITKYAERHELEDEFYGYLCRVMMSDSRITNEEQEYLDTIADSFELNKYDKRSIESSYKS